MARPRKSDAARRRLIDEGVASLLRHGYHGTGLQQVLDAAAVPKGSFYNFFRSKEDFAVAAIESYAECLGAELAAALAGARDPISGLKRFFRGQMAQFEQADLVGGCLVANLGAELEANDTCRPALKSAMLAYRHALRDALRAAQERGLVRTDLAPSDMADLLVDTWEGAVVRMKIERSTRPLMQCLKQLLDGYFRP